MHTYCDPDYTLSLVAEYATGKHRTNFKYVTREVNIFLVVKIHS